MSIISNQHRSPNFVSLHLALGAQSNMKKTRATFWAHSNLCTLLTYDFHVFIVDLVEREWWHRYCTSISPTAVHITHIGILASGIIYSSSQWTMKAQGVLPCSVLYVIPSHYERTRPTYFYCRYVRCRNILPFATLSLRLCVCLCIRWVICYWQIHFWYHQHENIHFWLFDCYHIHISNKLTQFFPLSLGKSQVHPVHDGLCDWCHLPIDNVSGEIDRNVCGGDRR